MLSFEELLILGQDDVNALVEYLYGENKKEGILFSNLEGQVKTWLTSYISVADTHQRSNL